MEDYLQQQIDDIDKRITEAKLLLSDPDLKDLVAEEIAQLEAQKEELTNSAQTPMKLEDEIDEDNELDGVNPNIAILEIRSAAGGDEAGLFAGDLFRMYTRFAEIKGWKV